MPEFSMMGLVALAFGYLCGSIPFGLLITRAAGMGDLRSVGSGNIGATNVLRMGSKKIAAATLVADIAKGAVPIFIANAFDPSTGVFAGLGAFFGHLYPVWLKFKGGKGVATFIGVLLGYTWSTAVVFCAAWLITAALFRYSSLAALVASALMPAAVFGLKATTLVVPVTIMVLAIYWRHRDNIKRLLSGQESRIGDKS